MQRDLINARVKMSIQLGASETCWEKSKKSSTLKV